MRKLFCAMTAILLTAATAPVKAEIDVQAIVSSTHYQRILPRHVDFYSYEKFLLGAATMPGFCTTGDSATRIRECAAFLANVAHETGGGRYITEKSKNQCPEYCDTTQVGACAPAPGQAYYGRGWLQTSWNYNYCEASKFMFHDDGGTLIRSPSILEEDALASMWASLWFWMMQAGAGTMPAHECMTTNAGFGCTIRSINGALECDGHNTAEVRSRVNNYLRFLAILSDGKVLPVGPNGC